MASGGGCVCGNLIDFLEYQITLLRLAVEARSEERTEELFRKAARLFETA